VILPVYAKRSKLQSRLDAAKMFVISKAQSTGKFLGEPTQSVARETNQARVGSKDHTLISPIAIVIVFRTRCGYNDANVMSNMKRRSIAQIALLLQVGP